MRQLALFIASIAALFGALFLIALSITLITSGQAGYGIALLLLGTPCALGMAIVFDYVENKMALTEDAELDVDIIKPTFTKFGGGGG